MDFGLLGDVVTTSNFSADGVHPKVDALAQALAAKHGDVRISLESGGTHLNMACPYCLERDGTVELTGKHLSVNADKFLGLGKWARRSATYDRDRTALCMKESKPILVSELLAMPPLEKRGIKESQHRCRVTSSKPILEEDANGNLVPERPGPIELPITALPPNHPAVEYVERRGYSRQMLWNMFQCSFCVQEHPEDEIKGRFYRRLPLNFRDTPQGRIILYCFVRGVRKAWQARILDKWEGSSYYVWHPYLEMWTKIKERMPDGEEVFVQGVDKWKPSKYKTATGSRRNEILMGFDAAVKFSSGEPRKNRTVLLCEGPLDAGRFGAPAVAMLGKYLSPKQALLLSGAFGKVVYLSDKDKAGQKSESQVRRMLQGRCDFILGDIPGLSEGQDPGDATPEAVKQVRNMYL